MKFTNLLFVTSLAAMFFLSACAKTQYSNFNMQGVPGWVIGGAKLEEAPPKRKPELLEPMQARQGAVGFGFSEKMETAEQAKKRKKAVRELFND